MAKITLNDLTTNYGSQTLHNTNNDTIEDHLNNKVLYRDNPEGQPNQMFNSLDMNSNDIINGNKAVFTQITVDGQLLDPDNTGVTTLPDQTGQSGKHLSTLNGSAFWNQLDLRDINTTVDNVFNVKDYGAVGDDLTDDAGAIKAAMDAAVAGGGGTVFFPAGTYFVDSTIVPEVAGETALDRANKLEAGTSVAGDIKDITIIGYGARLRSDDNTFTPTFPFTMLGFVGTERITIKGLQLESNVNNKNTGWFDETNYFNQTPPTPEGRGACMFVRYTDARLYDMVIEHCGTGIVMCDDRTFTISPTDEMLSYRSVISGCRIYNVPQGLSMTYGANEEWLIQNNHFEYTFIKCVQESDQGRAMHFKDNTCRDVSGLLLNCNDLQVCGNSFNNLLGGIRLQPQGGSNPSVTYSYDMFRTIIKDNVVYSDHLTDTQQGAANARPSNFISILSSSSATATQQPILGEVSINGNKVEIWPEGASSTGAFVGRSGDSDLTIRNMTINDNDVRFYNDNAVFLALAPVGVGGGTLIEGKIECNNNTFVRTVANANFEFQFESGLSFDPDTIVEFSNNYIDTMGTNRQVNVINIGTFISKNNKFIIGRFSSASGSTYYTGKVPRITIEGNDIEAVGNDSARGYILQFDGFPSAGYSSSLDKAVVRVNRNRTNRAQFVFSSLLTFPASSEGLYEILENVIDDGGGTDSYASTLPGFITYNVVNPYDSTSAPPVTSTIPSWYVCWSAQEGSSQPTGWKYGTVWTQIGTNP